MILDPVVRFIQAIIGESLVADPLVNGAAQLVALVVVILFCAVILMLPFALIVKILRWRKNKKC